VKSKFECCVSLLPEYVALVEPVATAYGFRLVAEMSHTNKKDIYYLNAVVHADTFNEAKGQLDKFTDALIVPWVQRRISHVMLDERIEQ
jgi:hypothetical protein